MTQQEIRQLCHEIINTEESISYSQESGGDIEERRENRKALAEMKTQVKEYLENQGLFGDWDDDAENLVACGFSKNQSEFILAAQEQGIELTSYSGRGMFGEYCPATREEVEFDGNTYTDSLGMGTVYYARY